VSEYTTHWGWASPTPNGIASNRSSSACRKSLRGAAAHNVNIFVERLWWTLKHHYLYLHAFDSGNELREGLTEWIRFYNHERGHSSLDDRTPDEVYYGLPHPFAEAA
jgi:putative transposase